jgi:hypothetical protein
VNSPLELRAAPEPLLREDPEWLREEEDGLREDRDGLREDEELPEERPLPEVDEERLLSEPERPRPPSS